MLLIDGEHWYRPMELAKRGDIRTPRSKTVSGRYKYILKLIKAGRLSARNYSLKNYVPYWIVSESEVNRFIRGPK